MGLFGARSRGSEPLHTPTGVLGLVLGLNLRQGSELNPSSGQKHPVTHKGSANHSEKGKRQRSRREIQRGLDGKRSPRGSNPILNNAWGAGGIPPAGILCGAALMGTDGLNLRGEGKKTFPGPRQPVFPLSEIPAEWISLCHFQEKDVSIHPFPSPTGSSSRGKRSHLIPPWIDCSGAGINWGE